MMPISVRLKSYAHNMGPQWCANVFRVDVISQKKGLFAKCRGRLKRSICFPHKKMIISHSCFHAWLKCNFVQVYRPPCSYMMTAVFAFTVVVLSLSFTDATR